MVKTKTIIQRYLHRTKRMKWSGRIGNVKIIWRTTHLKEYRGEKMYWMGCTVRKPAESISYKVLSLKHMARGIKRDLKTFQYQLQNHLRLKGFTRKICLSQWWMNRQKKHILFHYTNWVVRCFSSHVIPNLSPLCMYFSLPYTCLHIHSINESFLNHITLILLLPWDKIISIFQLPPECFIFHM